MGKYGPEKTPYLEISRAVIGNTRNINIQTSLKLSQQFPI